MDEDQYQTIRTSLQIIELLLSAIIGILLSRIGDWQAHPIEQRSNHE